MAVRYVLSRWSILIAAWAAMLMIAFPVIAQVQAVDPDAAIDGDLMGGSTELPAVRDGAPPAQDYWIDITQQPPAGNGTPVEPSSAARPAPTRSVDIWSADAIGDRAAAATQSQGATTYRKDDLMGAAEGVFGQGAEGLASIIEDLLDKQGEPNGYIVGREGGGAIGIGLRYGSGTLFHKIEGNRPVYWTGPSLGFDLGLNAGKAFVLVYNLHDSEDLYHRFGAGEGQAYLVGGFHVSYVRRGDVVLIPVRMGAGLRLGANVGYMKFSQKQKWMPF